MSITYYGDSLQLILTFRVDGREIECRYDTLSQKVVINDSLYPKQLALLNELVDAMKKHHRQHIGSPL